MSNTLTSTDFLLLFPNSSSPLPPLQPRKPLFWSFKLDYIFFSLEPHLKRPVESTAICIPSGGRHYIPEIPPWCFHLSIDGFIPPLSSFPLLNTAVCSFILLLKSIWTVSSFQLLWIKSLWRYLRSTFCGYLFAFLLDKGAESPGQRVGMF